MDFCPSVIFNFFFNFFFFKILDYQFHRIHPNNPLFDHKSVRRKCNLQTFRTGTCLLNILDDWRRFLRLRLHLQDSHFRDHKAKLPKYNHCFLGTRTCPRNIWVAKWDRYAHCRSLHHHRHDRHPKIEKSNIEQNLR